jgi:hypothetical protein
MTRGVKYINPLFFCCLTWFFAGIAVGGDYPTKIIWIVAGWIMALTVALGMA